MLVVFGSARSSPGVTTAVVAIASCLDRAIVVEGDPDGGVLAARFGLSKEPGLTTLAAGARAGSPEPFAIEAHQQELPGGVEVIVGPASPESATALWRSSGPRVASTLADVAHTMPVLVDAGRLSPVAPTASLLEVADLLVVVVRPILEDLHALVARTQSFRSHAARLVVLMVGEQPYGPADVAEQLGVQVIGVLASDPRAADALAGRAWMSRGLRRSSLARSARSVAERLVQSAPQGLHSTESVPMVGR